MDNEVDVKKENNAYVVIYIANREREFTGDNLHLTGLVVKCDWIIK